jgi:hypothetical protein
MPPTNNTKKRPARAAKASAGGKRQKRARTAAPSSSTSSASSLAPAPPSDAPSRWGLYDGDGTRLLAEVPLDEDAEVTVLGQTCTLRVVEAGAALELTQWRSSDDKAARCQAVAASRAHERAAREQDLALVEADVQAKMEEMARNYAGDVSALRDELEQLILLKGHHQARIAELAPTRNVTVRTGWRGARRWRPAGRTSGRRGSGTWRWWTRTWWPKCRRWRATTRAT